MPKKTKDDFRNDFGSTDERQRESISDERSGTLSRRRFLGGVGAAAVAAAVGCKDRSPSVVDADAGPDVHEDGGVDADGGPDIVEDGGQDDGTVVVEDGGQNGGGEDLGVLRAFPGAEGGGALTVGGRGGQIFEVITLDDNGSQSSPIQGSLRWAINQPGPRIIIFRVGGTITLQGTALNVSDPYCTIAGQTAPGGGIQIRQATGNTLFNITTHNVVLRYLRLRRGYHGSKDHTLNITGGNDIIVSHCSMYWTENQNLTVYGWGSSGVNNLTVQNSIIAEPVSGRVNAYIGHSAGIGNFNTRDVDLHHNLIAFSSHRNPMLRHGQGRFINNIIYGSYRYWLRAGPNSHIDAIGNLFKNPTDAGFSSSGALREIEFWAYATDMSSHDRRITPDMQTHSYYVAGNRGLWSGMQPSADQWNDTRWVPTAGGVSPNNQAANEPPPTSWKRSPWQPLSPAGVPITVHDVDSLEDYLLDQVGPYRGLDVDGNWELKRDTTDARVVSQYRNGTGIVRPNHETDVGGFPTIDNGTPYPHTGDGIANAWKTRNGFSASADIGSQEVPGLNGWTYMDLFLAGIDVPT